MATRSSHPLLSCTDGIATGMTDLWLLIGRILIALVFLMTVWTGGPAAAYLKSLHYPGPEFMSVLAHIVEWIVVASLILGVATRYGALLGLAFVGDRLCHGASLLGVSGGGANPAIRLPQQGPRHRRRPARAFCDGRRPLQR